MKILQADYIYVDGKYIENSAIVFDKKIEYIGSIDDILSKYPNIEIEKLAPNSVIFPGFINTHVHLEFSSNQTTLEYGSFVGWLRSVISNREDIISNSNNKIMRGAIYDMLASGITAYGAISSYGGELEESIKAKQKVVFFNELIGSNPQTVDMLYSDFLERLELSSNYSQENIKPAIAIHSPYSVHPIVVKRAISLAKEKQIPLSVHFLESSSEKEWLAQSTGEFREFFEEFLNQTNSLTTKDDFLDLFNGYSTHLTHAVEVDNDDIDKISQNHHSIAHCPRSNRYLGGKPLALKKIIDKDIKFSTATDGMSSNYSLNILDELKSALMIHHNIDINILADKLIESITKSANDILGLNGGVLKEGRDSDIVVMRLPNEPKSLDRISLWTILHCNEADRVYIDGKIAYQKI